jgi:hypothetical protein
MKKIITLSIVFLSLVAFNVEAKTKKESCSKKMMKPKTKSLVKYQKPKKKRATINQVLGVKAKQRLRFNLKPFQLKIFELKERKQKEVLDLSK